MTTSELAAALADWAGETLGIAGAADHEPKETEPLPDVWAVTKTIRYADVPQDQAIQQAEIQQARFKVSSFALMVFVEPEPIEDASEALNEYADGLAAAADEDRSLGIDGIEIADDFDFDFHFEAPFAELNDGARARRMTMNLVAVEAIQT